MDKHDDVSNPTQSHMDMEEDGIVALNDSQQTNGQQVGQSRLSEEEEQTDAKNEDNQKPRLRSFLDCVSFGSVAASDLVAYFASRPVKKSANNPDETQSLLSNDVERFRSSDDDDVPTPAAAAGATDAPSIDHGDNVSHEPRSKASFDIEKQDEALGNHQATTERKRKQQRMCYMLCRVGLSLIGHGVLLGVSFIPGFGEKNCGHHEEETSKKWLKWALMDLIAPIVVLIGMFIMQIFLDLYLEEDDTSQRTPQDKKREKTNKLVNLGMLAASKVFYVGIIEAPGPKKPLRISAHVVALVIDMVGAIWLWKKHSGLDPEMLDISSKDD